ncbi:protein disulfide-isomerase domain-containing protein [Besnoitia besnoiti]|uniref:Protein disulfide-isomerase domain-containing protein n=1 Tax=Besnoitia besnoiti TaxID=94643 RepID=A0A2A9M6W6_BESBE|nr:protein disulfide-isomerase domain-containing protein [Besnoitia besnoiti]PFH32934.1 protein disulfide-isomerase domain-containing protein [Besnoitia besnoiti]
MTGARSKPVSGGGGPVASGSALRRRPGFSSFLPLRVRAFASRVQRYFSLKSLSVFVVVLGVFYYLGQQRLLTVSHFSFLTSGLGLHSAFNVPVRHFSFSLHSDKRPIAEAEKRAVAGADFKVSWSTEPSLPVGARITTHVVSKKNGDFLLRFRVLDSIPAGYTLKAKALYTGKNFEKAIVDPLVVRIPGPVLAPTCACPAAASAWKEALQCPETFTQLERDFAKFPVIDLERLRKEGPAFAEPNTLKTVIHYVVKDNQIFRRHFGPLPGFQYFIDLVLSYLVAAVQLPDVEFFVNLGDWPLEKRQSPDALPLFSWSGSEDSSDIILPQWDVSKTSTLGLGKAYPDLLSMQENSGLPLSERIAKAVFRGRDSNEIRVKLAELARQHPDLLDVAITSWEKDEHAEQEKKLGGGYRSRIPLEKFGDYKYQLLVDGSVAAYRTPYLLMTGSLSLKHDSPYYEWFYADLKPGVHYLPFKRDLSDLVEQLKWAEAHPEDAQAIADRARKYAQENLTPEKIFCYYFKAFETYAARQKGTPTVTEDMAKVEPPASDATCACDSKHPQEAKKISYPVVPLTTSNIAKVLGDAQTDVVIVSYSSFCNRSASFMPKYLKAAQAFAAKKAPVLFAAADGNTNTFAPPHRFCNYASQPRVIFVPQGKGQTGEDVQVMEDPLTVFNTVAFVAKHVAPEFRPTVPEDPPELMSQPVPTDNSKPVKIVVGATFDSFVLDSDKDVLLEVYAPWCGHCKSLKPTYEEFAKLVSQSPSASKSLVVAKMNGTENATRHKQFSWTSYPTIWLIKAGSRTPTPFTGPRTLRGFYDFILKHGSNQSLSIDGIPPPEPEFPSGPSAAAEVTAANFEQLVLHSAKVGAPVLDAHEKGS